MEWIKPFFKGPEVNSYTSIHHIVPACFDAYIINDSVQNSVDALEERLTTEGIWTVNNLSEYLLYTPVSMRI